MKLKICICDDEFASKKFIEDFYLTKKKNHTSDSGLDLVIPHEHIIPARITSYKIGLGVRCEPVFDDFKVRGYFIFPRSSTGSKTPLRLSNSVGIIDNSYRGELMVCVDNLSDIDYKITKGQRLFQLCSPDLSPIDVEVCTSLSVTERQAGGYGSTGV